MSIKFPGVIATLAANAATEIRRSRVATDEAGASNQPASTSSTSVTLSDEAMSLARLSAKGLEVSSGKLSSPLNMGSGPAPSSHLSEADSHPIGEEAFAALLRKMGADEASTATLMQGLDTNQDKQISKAEIMRGLGDAGNGNQSEFAQELRRLMDAQGDASGSVSGREFMALASSLYSALKR